MKVSPLKRGKSSLVITLDLIDMQKIKKFSTALFLTNRDIGLSADEDTTCRFMANLLEAYERCIRLDLGRCEPCDIALQAFEIVKAVGVTP